MKTARVILLASMLLQIALIRVSSQTSPSTVTISGTTSYLRIADPEETIAVNGRIRKISDIFNPRRFEGCAPSPVPDSCVMPEQCLSCHPSFNRAGRK